MTTLRKISQFFTSQAFLFAYACLFMIHSFLNFTFITANSSFLTKSAYIFAIVGSVMVVFCLICKKPWRRQYNRSQFSPRGILMLLLIVMMCVTVVMMRNYNFSDNIKAIIWMAVDLVVLCMLSDQKTGDVWIRRFMLLFVWIVGIYAVLSVFMAIVGYFYDPYGLPGDLVAGGLALGRLYGMYSDPNYGAPISGIAIVTILYLFAKKDIKNLFTKIVMIIFIVSMLLYIGLSGSRTALLSSGSILFVFFLLFMLFKLKKCMKINKLTKICLSVVTSTALSVLLIFSVFGLSSMYEKCEPIITHNIGGPVSNVKTTYPFSFADNVTKQNEMVSDATVQKSANEKLSTYVLKKPASDQQNTNQSSATGSNTSNSNEKTEAHVGFLGRSDYGDVSNGRFSIWKSGLEIMMDSPVFGLSSRGFLSYAITNYPDSFLAKSGFNSMHNSYFQILISQGLIGFILAFGICICFFINLFVGIKQSWKQNNYNKFIEYAYLISLLVACLVICMFLAEIFYVVTILSAYFWYVIGHVPECYCVKEVKIEN